MSESPEQLNTRVTEAIFHAEHEPEGTAAAEAAFRAVSELEEKLARAIPADQLQGGLARIGAVTAALQAGDWLRAAWLAESFAAGAPADVAEQLRILAGDAEKASREIAEPNVLPISFELRAA